MMRIEIHRRWLTYFNPHTLRMNHRESSFFSISHIMIIDIIHGLLYLEPRSIHFHTTDLYLYFTYFISISDKSNGILISGICPPPLTMIIFSVLEIIMFLYDVIYFRYVIIDERHR